MNGVAGGLLPFHMILGALTGSTKHDELIIRAYVAAGAQRAYLNGLGEQGGCRELATPRHRGHFTSRQSTTARQSPGFRRYAISKRPVDHEGNVARASSERAASQA